MQSNTKVQFSTIDKNSNKKKIRFILNPKSGTKNKEFILKLIHKYLDKQKYSYEICYTDYAKHAIELSLEAANLNYEMVIAIGGDGTVNEVGKGLLGTNTKMGIIRAGSGDGLARHIHIPKNPKKAIEIINNNYFEDIYSIKMGDEVFLSVAGVGFDAHIAHEFAKVKKRGFLSYAKLVLNEFFSYQNKDFEMVIDGIKIKKSAFILSFANGSQYGNDFKIAPKAKLISNSFVVAILKKPSFFDRLSTVLKLRHGKIEKSNYYENFECKNLQIVQKSLLSHIDGEPVEFKDSVEVYPYKKLKILVP